MGTIFNVKLASDVPVRISGFMIDTRGSTAQNAISITGLATKVRIDHNWFEHGLGGIVWNYNGWTASGPVEGVIDHNMFHNQAISLRPSDLRTNDTNITFGSEKGIDGGTAWTEPIQAGTAHNMFVEDNVFLLDSGYPLSFYCTFAGCGQYLIYGNSQGGSAVIRNNLFTGFSAGYIDAHGDTAPGSRQYSTKFYEIYNNTFIRGTAGDGSGGGIGDQRGGSWLVWGNNISNSYGYAWQIFNTCSSYTHPIKDTYYWNNNYSGSMVDVIDPSSCSPMRPRPVLDKDYFFHAPAVGQTFYGYTPYTYRGVSPHGLIG